MMTFPSKNDPCGGIREAILRCIRADNPRRPELCAGYKARMDRELVQNRVWCIHVGFCRCANQLADRHDVGYIPTYSGNLNN